MPRTAFNVNTNGWGQRIYGHFTITIPVLTLAIWLWILDIFGIERWVAETIGFFLHMVVEQV